MRLKQEEKEKLLKHFFLFLLSKGWSTPKKNVLDKYIKEFLSEYDFKELNTIDSKDKNG